MRTLAVKRIVGLLVMAAGLVATAWFSIDGLGHRAKFMQWLNDVPIKPAEIDFSREGMTSLPFEQTCEVSHGEFVYIESEYPEKDAEIFQSLAGRIEIRSQSGELIETTQFDSLSFPGWANEFTLASIPAHIATGSYVAEFHINTPANSVDPVVRKLTAGYMLCGLEMFPAYLCWAAALVALIATIIVGTNTMPWVLQFGIWNYEIEP